jgi:arylsulfatase A-like enzyme/Tfp pilus assembly protein PilF
MKQALSIALLLLVFCSGCATGDATGKAAGDRPSVLLITLDTTRADKLGCYGATDAETPNMDRLASEGVLMEQAISVVPITLPSHVSILTGQYPPRHGVRLNGAYKLPAEGTTLAERFRAEGYSTGAVVAAYVLSATFGIDQGFDHFKEPEFDRSVALGGSVLAHREIIESDAGEVTDKALALLNGGELPEPFFLWVHYYDPHGEYTPPEPFAGRFEDRLYEGEIAYLDQELGRLLDGLGDRYDRTLTALTADHGESLGEHGENTHALFVYDATMHVPMMLRWPGKIEAGLRSGRVASLVDLAPTMLELLDLPAFEGIDGESFAPVLRGEPMEPRDPVYSESEMPLRSYGWAGLYALRDHRRKFIRAPELEYYDLEADPGETNNVAFNFLGDVGLWAQKLDALEQTWPAAVDDAARPADQETLEKLAALGYVSGGTTPPERDERPNPRSYVQLHNLLLDTQTLVGRGAHAQALELARKAVELDPDNPAALELSGTLLCSAERCDEGIEQLQRAGKMAPHSFQTHHNLGNALHLAGRLPEAAQAYRAAVEIQPFAAQTHHALGNVLLAMRDASGAVASYRLAERSGLDTGRLQAALGTALTATGDVEGARTALTRAVELDPALADAWNQLGILHEKNGEAEAALERYGRALEADALHAGALFNRSKVQLRLGRLDEAAEGTQQLLAAHPTYAPARFLDAQVHLARDDEAAARRSLQQLIDQPGVDPRLAEAARELLTQI